MTIDDWADLILALLIGLGCFVLIGYIIRGHK